MAKDKKIVLSEQREKMALIWSPQLRDNPENFVMFVFPWNKPGTPLEGLSGPRKWQREVLREIADFVAVNNDPQRIKDKTFEIFQKAIASGRGIGKTGLLAMIAIWFMTTRIGGTTVLSANSEQQTKTGIHAEVLKWIALSVHKEWFETSATRIAPAEWLADMVQRDLLIDPRQWGIEIRLWSDTSPDSYAGLHNPHGVLVLWDEASGIADAIWPVAAGFFTENSPNRLWVCASNPRRNSGAFFECFHANRNHWKTVNIDSRSVENLDTTFLDQMVEQHGADSATAYIECYGQFYLSDDITFIQQHMADEAMKRHADPAILHDPTAPIIIGVDPARSGVDSTVICVRQGRKVLAIQRWNDTDLMLSVGRVIDAVEEYRPAMIVADEGGLGGGLVDRLKEQGYKIRGVDFGRSSPQPKKYQNMRAFMWGNMRDWLQQSGAIPKDQRLKIDLCGAQYTTNSSGSVILESKKSMRARGLASPDSADALAMTFAYKVAGDTVQGVEQAKKMKRLYASWGQGTSTSWLGS